MLEHTFCHIPGVGRGLERRWWDDGICCWDDADKLTGPRGTTVQSALEESARRLAAADLAYFGRLLPSKEHWRLFPALRPKTAYLDIETTGLGGPDDYITTIAIYDGRQVRHYVHGQNMAAFENDIADYDLLVTYNGKSFDVPFIRRCLRVDLRQEHIDLRHVLRSLGYTGGLKGIERQLGQERPDMDDIDGFFAVILWQEYRRTRQRAVLDTLLAYNVQDVLSLETLMVFAFNAKLAQTPFAQLLQLRPTAPAAKNPFQVNRTVVNRLKRTPQYARWAQ